VRVKSRWSKKDKTHSVEEIAGALAFIIWRIATNAVLSMENADFQTETQRQRLDIIAEFLVFAIHVADRMTIENFDEEQRIRFMTELAQKCAKHMEDNKRDVIGPGEYRQAFIELLNQRMADYAEFGYSEQEGPSFGMKRFFGDQVKHCFNAEDQKWVSSQVIDIEVPEIMTHLKRATPNLFM
jgi:ribosomal protein S15P/S13E